MRHDGYGLAQPATDVTKFKQAENEACIREMRFRRNTSIDTSLLCAHCEKGPTTVRRTLGAAFVVYKNDSAKRLFQRLFSYATNRVFDQSSLCSSSIHAFLGQIFRAGSWLHSLRFFTFTKIYFVFTNILQSQSL